MRKKFKLTVFAIALILAVTACAGKEKHKQQLQVKVLP